MNTTQNNITKVTLVSAGAILFSVVFWQEKLGLNTVLFDMFILAALFYLYPQSLKRTTVRWLLLAHLICLAMVVVHNTLLSKLAFTVTLFLLTGFSEYYHRSVLFAGGSVLMNILMVAASFSESVKGYRRKTVKRRKLSRVIRFAIFPLLIVLIFFIVYLLSNNIFQEMASELGTQLEIYFSRFFTIFSWQWILFLLLGLLVTGSLLLKSRLDYFSGKEAGCRDELQRVRRPLKHSKRSAFQSLVHSIMGSFATGTLALKNEHITGTVSLVLLNMLLLVVNIIDINYLWFNFEYDSREPIFKLVHEGTELLILSIVMAMAIVLFFFKGNLNFYRRNKGLKLGAYAWIVQNAVLVISVGIRDYYYIERHGLAYKRIGVLFFLLMVLIGLITVFIKITGKRTGYFLFRVNAWAGIVILTLTATIHWDERIAAYNLQRKDQVTLDVPFLLQLSDKTLPLLEANIAVLKMYEKHQPEDNNAEICNTCYTEQLKQREAAFLHQQQQLTWLSWNLADASVSSQLSKHKKNK